MHLRRFVADNPNCEVGRPDWATPLAAMLSAAGAGLGAIAAAWYAREASDGAALLWLLLGLGLGYPAWLAARAFAERWSLARRGRGVWALGDRDLLLVDGDGNAIVIALDRVLDVAVCDGEVSLRTDSELQGVLYGILFRLFDEDVPGPSMDRFYDVMRARLRTHRPAPGSIHPSEHPRQAAA